MRKSTIIIITIVIAGLIAAIAIPNIIILIPPKFELPLLHRQVIQRGYKTIKILLISGYDVNKKDSWVATTSLHWAAVTGHTEIAELLIAEGADIDARDDYENTPLHYAVSSKQAGMTQLLVRHGADIMATNHWQETPLHCAVDYPLWCLTSVFSYTFLKPYTPDVEKIPDGDRRKIVEFLIASGANVEAKDSVSANTPLHAAARGGNSEIVQLLLSKGGDIHARTSNDWTPLHYAALNGQTAVVEFLIRAGADIYARTNDGETPLACAARSYSPKEMFTLLAGAEEEVSVFDTPDDATCFSLLSNAAVAGNREAIEFFIERGMDLHTPEGEGALHSAAYNFHTDIVELLLQYGISVHATRCDGRTPLHSAVERKRSSIRDEDVQAMTAIVKLFLAYGADMNASDEQGISPILLANENGLVEITEVFSSYDTNDLVE